MLQESVIRRVERFNEMSRSDRAPSPALEDLAHECGLEWQEIATRLVVYGSLAPGRANHHQLARLHGTWRPVVVRGHLIASGWGNQAGYPGFRWDELGEPVSMQLFSSAELPVHWRRLDQFEGDDYRRILVPVHAVGQVLVANIYSLAT